MLSCGSLIRERTLQQRRMLDSRLCWEVQTSLADGLTKGQIRTQKAKPLLWSIKRIHFLFRSSTTVLQFNLKRRRAVIFNIKTQMSRNLKIFLLFSQTSVLYSCSILFQQTKAHLGGKALTPLQLRRLVTLIKINQFERRIISHKRVFSHLFSALPARRQEVQSQWMRQKLGALTCGLQSKLDNQVKCADAM